MSEASHYTPTTSKQEHGTTRSYIIGFLLSLVFTVVPYYMVVNKTVSASTLLATILGFAVLQMAIQIFFFLHLGRGPKPMYNVVFFGSTVGIILVVVVGSMWIMNHLNYNMAPTEISKNLIEKEKIYQVGGEKTGACQGVHANHKVSITGGRVAPMHTEAQICDTFTLINNDEAGREITFGPHPKHETYAGETGLMLRKGRGKTITLNQAGTYEFHDHLDPRVAGYFTVATEDENYDQSSP
jgi:cytochrome o ubiquinol oxidase subunit IV